jgi:hypothetical protein
MKSEETRPDQADPRCRHHARVARRRRPPPRRRCRRPRRSRVADDLRRRILAGELAPGQRLKIDELASLCEVSHMPVREALRELEGEGVLDVFPHRGAVDPWRRRRGSCATLLRRARGHRGHAHRALRRAHRRRRGSRASQAAVGAVRGRGEEARRVGAARREPPLIHDTINAVAANAAGGARARSRGGCWPRRCGCASATAAAASDDDGRASTRALVRAISRRDAERAGRPSRASHCVAGARRSARAAGRPAPRTALAIAPTGLPAPCDMTGRRTPGAPTPSPRGKTRARPSRGRPMRSRRASYLRRLWTM